MYQSVLSATHYTNSFSFSNWFETTKLATPLSSAHNRLHVKINQWKTIEISSLVTDYREFGINLNPTIIMPSVFSSVATHEKKTTLSQNKVIVILNTS